MVRDRSAFTDSSPRRICVATLYCCSLTDLFYQDSDVFFLSFHLFRNVHRWPYILSLTSHIGYFSTPLFSFLLSHLFNQKWCDPTFTTTDVPKPFPYGSYPFKVSVFLPTHHPDAALSSPSATMLHSLLLLYLGNKHFCVVCASLPRWTSWISRIIIFAPGTLINQNLKLLINWKGTMSYPADTKTLQLATLWIDAHNVAILNTPDRISNSTSLSYLIMWSRVRHRHRPASFASRTLLFDVPLYLYRLSLALFSTLHCRCCSSTTGRNTHHRPLLLLPQEHVHTHIKACSPKLCNKN